MAATGLLGYEMTMSRLTKAERSRELTFELRWPEFAACMARAARSSGVPFATLARAAEAARKALAECGRSEWIGAVSGDGLDPQNWRYGRLPRKGDWTVVFDPPPQALPMTTNMDMSGIRLGSLTVTKAARDAGFSIGTQGRAYD